MVLRIRPLTAALAVAFSSSAFSQPSSPQNDETSATLDNVTVRARRTRPEADPTQIDRASIAAQRVATSDTATLLRDVPGLSLNSAGGVSSLPSLHGLADDRIRTRVDGMDLISACANHMNSPLSYIDPSNVDSISVYAGISPVSYGGDSIAGTIFVKSRDAKFAAPGQGLLTNGELGGFYRSNGNGWGANASASVATENLSIRYNGATAQSNNYKSAGEFKAGVQQVGTTVGSHWIAGNEVGSSAFKTENHALDIAWKLDNHLIDLKLGYQHIPYQGFPNQHMDMTGNESTQINLGYTGKFDWGKLEARIYNEHTQHKMDFAEDKLYWYSPPNTPCAPAGPSCVQGMPMDTDGKNTGVQVRADIRLAGNDWLRLGAEYQRYRLSDWWAPSGGMMMWPNAFQNINNGKRDHVDLFAEWEANWSKQWMTLAGVRGSIVDMDTGTVQGYNAGMAYGAEAAAFNQSDRARTDHNLDLTLLARYTANAKQNYEGGFARKTRSPSLYERYIWSSNGMAMTMNNWQNDGNGYVGNPDLKPEVANTLSFTADWHDPASETWGVRVTPYFSRVTDYIDAKRCFSTAASTTCGNANKAATGKFVYLTLANNDAQIYGLDLSAYVGLGRINGVGSFTARGLVSYINGTNRSTGDKLYNIMPLNAKLALEHRIGGWTNTVEGQLVSGKHDVSAVRNEMQTSGYGLLNLRSSYEWKNLRFDLGLENALDKQYALPLGGAYIGQGTTMSLNGSGASYGIAMPGMGRSLYAGMNIKF